MAFSLLPGPILGFSFAFDPGTCNPNFSEANFIALILLASGSLAGIAYCLKQAFQK